MILKSEPYYGALANAIGINSAIVLSKIHHWCEYNAKTNRVYVEGYYWTSRTIEEMLEKDFNEVFSLRTLKTIINNLTKDGLIVVGKGKGFNNHGRSNRCYRVDYLELKNKTGLEFEGTLTKENIKNANSALLESEKFTPAIGKNDTPEVQNLHLESAKSAPLKCKTYTFESAKSAPCNKRINKNIKNNNKSSAKLSNDINNISGLDLFDKWCKDKDIKEPSLYDSGTARVLAYIKQFYKDEKPVTLRDKEITYEALVERLQELDINHVEYVAYKLENDIDLSNVSSPRFYVLPILYNAVNEIDDYFEKVVNRDLYSNVNDDEFDYSLEWLENE